MSEILSKEQRERLARMAGTPAPDRASTYGKWVGLLGCLVSSALMLAAMAGAVFWIWRKAVGG